MKRGRFLIAGLAAAGIMPLPATAQQSPRQSADKANTGGLSHAVAIDLVARDHYFLLAQHRSHSSHASHASHASHRSSSSGSSSPRVSPPPPPPRPAPTPTPSSRNSRSTPPSSVLPSSPSTAPRQSLVDDPFKATVIRVQQGLRAYGYYRGALDGAVGPETRAALVRFQTDYDLKVTGTVTPEVLDALDISSP